MDATLATRKRGGEEIVFHPPKKERTDSGPRDKLFLLSQGSLLDAPAKWCFRQHDQYQLDENYLSCFLSPEELKDQSLVRDIVHGALPTGRLYPLIFDEFAADYNETVRLRSLLFFEQLIADGDDGRARYDALSLEMKRIVGLGVRDLYLGAWKGHLNDRERTILDGMVEILDGSVGRSQVGGMNVSFHPSANCKVLKFIEDLDQKVAPELSSFFAQVLHTPKLFAVFVDPAELSYHNFENIVPLDRWIESKHGDKSKLQLTLTNPTRFLPHRRVFTSKLQGPSCDLLKQLAQLDLYVPPLNKETRGGERFIFHSALLSKALTDTIKSSDFLNPLANAEVDPSSTFEFVNYVFRCNRFAPGSAKFTSHRDTPYYDSARSHVSKYTVLIYLTSGFALPMLRVGDMSIGQIEEMTCVIFDQSVEHEGHPFVDTEKIFLRTELVFKTVELQHDTRIASLFSEACYMTGHGVFDADLARYAHACFERANSLHWAIEQEGSETPVYLRKQFRGMQFMTNGYDYWIQGGEGINVADVAMVAVLDYFNCKIGEDKAFRQLCDVATVRRKFGGTEEIWSFLDECGTVDVKPMKRVTVEGVNGLAQKRQMKPFVRRQWDAGFDADEDTPEPGWEPCCPFHAWPDFNAWNDEYVRKDYRKCWKYTRDKLFGAPLIFLGEDIMVNESNVKVQGDKIFIFRDSNTKPLPAINFAACWGELDTSQFIVPDGSATAPDLLLPPILLHQDSRGYHLVLDLFRNDWMVKVDAERAITLPVITNDLPDSPTEAHKIWDLIGLDSDDARSMSDDSEDWLDPVEKYNQDTDWESDDDLDTSRGGSVAGDSSE